MLSPTNDLTTTEGEEAISLYSLNTLCHSEVYSFLNKNHKKKKKKKKKKSSALIPL